MEPSKGKIKDGYGRVGRKKAACFFHYPFFHVIRQSQIRSGGQYEKSDFLTVSFGTSHLDTLEKTIGAIERELAEAFPDRTLYRAFTSGMVIEN